MFVADGRDLVRTEETTFFEKEIALRAVFYTVDSYFKAIFPYHSSTTHALLYPNHLLRMAFE